MREDALLGLMGIRALKCSVATYHGFPHGMPTTQAATIDADLLAFIRE